MWVEILGWACASLGVALSLPQIVRLLRAGSSSGLSLIMWQINVAAGLAWGVHGLRSGWLNLIVPNFAIAAITSLVVYMIAADRRLKPVPVIAIIINISAALVAIEWFTTPETFGLAVAVPVAFGFITQTREIARTHDLSGVSLPYISLTTLNQSMWIAWGIIRPDTAIALCATILCVISGTNMVWLILRRRGIVAARP